MNRSIAPSLIVRAVLRGVELAMGFVLFYSGFLSLYARLMLRRRIAVLYYHEVGDVPVLEGAATDVGTFERQMRLVARWRRGISIDQLHDCLAGTGRLPDHPVLVTFDGGYRGVMTHAVPVCRRLGIPVTIYLVTGYIDERNLPHAFRIAHLLERTDEKTLVARMSGVDRTFRLDTDHERRACRSALMQLLNDTPPADRDAVLETIARRLRVDPDEAQPDLFMTWEEIAAANGDGLARFESHSVNHPNLPRLPAEAARGEITESKEAIERITGRAVTSFCYPMGYYSAEIKEMVRAAGYRSAVTVRYGLSGCDDDPWELNRIAVHDNPLCVFAMELCGIYKSGTMMVLFDRLKVRLKRGRI